MKATFDRHLLATMSSPAKAPRDAAPPPPAAPSSSSLPPSDANVLSLRLHAKRATPASVAVASAAGVEPHAEHFARAVALMAAAHIARGVGFDAVQRSAGDALAEILARYIQRIGASAKDIAEHAGRTQPRATDVAMALEDALPVAMDLPDLIKALQTAKRPFPRDIPAFPVRKNDLANSTLDQSKIGNREQLPAYAPSFLPPLPNRHTYSNDSRVVVERERDHKRTRLDLLAQKSHVQQSLHGLDSAVASTTPAIVPQQAWNAFQGMASEPTSGNPFVQPPVLQGGTASQKKSVFGALPDREFAPSTNRDRAQKKNALDSAAGMNKLPSAELGKEEKILTGTFHDGDSE